MKIIKNPEGKLNVNASLSTLEVGDTVSLSERDVKIDYLRTAACKIARANDWVIEVSNSRDLNGIILIRRTK